MEKLFGNLAKPFRLKTSIDSIIFKLHYKFTSIILIAASLIVTAKLFIGEPINCISRDDIPTKLLNTFCWIHATFSVDSAWFKKIGEEIPYPGVDKYTENETRVYHAYYQWVCFVLFLQAIFFYLPHYFWKRMERGLIHNLISPFDPLAVKKEDRKNAVDLLVAYLKDSRNNHSMYYHFYVLSMAWNFINIIAQMYIINTFLGGEFTSYGTEVIKFTDWDWKLRYDPMLKVFPRMTKCTFHRYGSSGDVQRHDALCLLPINIINEKIYVFMWFWFIILSVFTAMELVYRFIAILKPDVQFYLNKLAFCFKTTQEEIDQSKFFGKLEYGTVFVLNQVKSNLNPLHFRLLFRKLSEEKFV